MVEDRKNDNNRVILVEDYKRTEEETDICGIRDEYTKEEELERRIEKEFSDYFLYIGFLGMEDKDYLMYKLYVAGYSPSMIKEKLNISGNLSAIHQKFYRLRNKVNKASESRERYNAIKNKLYDILNEINDSESQKKEVKTNVKFNMEGEYGKDSG